MAAIGYSMGKQVCCFPWFSRKRYESYHKNLSWLMEMLENLEMTVILPIGK